MASDHKPIAPLQIGHQTTIPNCRSTYTTASILGQKRPLITATNFPEQKVLRDITSKIPRNDFVQPTLASATKRLKASPIGPYSDNGPLSGSVSLYSQRRSVAATPTPESDPYLSLSHPRYGLPLRLVQNFTSLGVNSIYPWQSRCLSSRLMSGQGNLVYTAPTGGGKSLVADILMLKKVIENPGKKAILVLPYVALVQEKLRWLRAIVEGVSKVKDSDPGFEERSIWQSRGDEQSVRIVGLFGGSKVKANWTDMDIAVCTIEKANALVNTAIEDCTVGQLGIVVMDELHMLDDENRGFIMELMATKLLSLEQNLQLVGMSATLPNTELLAKWLNAKYYVSKYQPVPIEEHLVFENAIYPASSSGNFYQTATQLNAGLSGDNFPKPKPIRNIEPSEAQELAAPIVNAVVALAVEAAIAGHGVLVFCSSRLGCETDADVICQAMPCASEIENDILERRMDLLGDLRSTTTGLDHMLERTIPCGVGFHHAGLTTEERDLISNAYNIGTIKILVATCTLAAGINLPARRVILHGARMGRELVGPSMLRQMRGRAGRKGKDEVGETYLCCQKSDIEAVAELMESEVPAVTSCLSGDQRRIDRALLEIVAIKLATSVNTVNDYMRKTLVYHTTDPDDLARLTRATLDGLEQAGLIRVQLDNFEATLLGQAVVASALSPQDGTFIYQELTKAMQAFVLDGEMHVLYTFTPVQSVAAQIDWQIFQKELDKLDESALRVLDFVGIKPTTINEMARGATFKESTMGEIELGKIYRRFYTALQLRDLCIEMPIHAVARKYKIPRGVVQNLAQSCHGFAAGMVKFCKRMEWDALAAVLDHMSDRLKAGARSDLLALAQITYIKSRTARIFWENGFRSVAAIAAADIQVLLPVLLQAQPRKPRLHPDDELKYQQKLLAKAEIISKSASRIWERTVQQEFEEE